MMERRDAHVGFRSQLLNVQVLGVFGFNPLQHPANQAEMGLAADQRQQRAAARPHQNVIQNFANNLFPQNARIQRPFHHI